MPVANSPPDLARVVAAFASIPHGRLLRMRLDEVKHGRATMSLPYGEELIGNPRTGIVHGGVITALLDTLCGLATMTSVPEGTALATLDLRIDYLRPAKPNERIHATAECYRVTPTIAFTRGVAYHDNPDNPIAQATGTFMLGAVGFSTAGARPPTGEE